MTIKTKRKRNKKINKMTLKELNSILSGLHLVKGTSLYRKHIEDRIRVVTRAEAHRVYWAAARDATK